MPSTALSNRRIAIFEDNLRNRERLSDMVTRCGATALPVDSPAPKLSDLSAYLNSQRANMVVCDHHLSQQKDYAPYLGAEAVAKCYALGIAGILVTAFESADAESSLRVFRRHIPALVRSPQDLDRNHLEAALLRADSEVREKRPSRERIPHRTIMTVQRIEPRSTSKVVKVMMAQWDATQEVGFPLDLVPKKFHAGVKPGKMLIAEVNIEAARQEDLFFDKFELPDADVLKKAKNLFGRP
jgi:CheY-like chemotaxis protein